MAGERDLAEAVKALVGMDDLQYESSLCIVSDVNTTTNTCTCTPVNGNAPYYDVSLSCDLKKGFLLIPTNGSQVICTETSETTAYISMVSDVTQVYIAGDANGGLIKIDNLKSQYDANIAAIKTAVSTALGIVDTQLIALGQAGGSVASFNGLASNILNLNKTPLENLKVLHGNG